MIWVSGAHFHWFIDLFSKKNKKSELLQLGGDPKLYNNK